MMHVYECMYGVLRPIWTTAPFYSEYITIARTGKSPASMDGSTPYAYHGKRATNIHVQDHQRHRPIKKRTTQKSLLHFITTYSNHTISQSIPYPMTRIPRPTPKDEKGGEEVRERAVGERQLGI